MVSRSQNFEPKRPTLRLKNIECLRVDSIFLFCSLIVQFDAVAQTSFFKYRVSPMCLYLIEVLDQNRARNNVPLI